MDIQTLKDVEILYNYLRLNNPLHQADVLLVLGSHDLRVAKYAAELFKQELAPIVVISGGIAHIGDLLETGWKRTEAEEFAQVMMTAGVPTANIILETRAQNTGDNFKLSGELLSSHGIKINSAIVVTKPYMERHAFATGKVQWPTVDLIMSSPPFTFKEYLANIDQTVFINIMVGDLQRIIEYPSKGFQISQEVPRNILEAYNRLVAVGFDKHLIEQ